MNFERLLLAPSLLLVAFGALYCVLSIWSIVGPKRDRPHILTLLEDFKNCCACAIGLQAR